MHCEFFFLSLSLSENLKIRLFGFVYVFGRRDKIQHVRRQHVSCWGNTAVKRLSCELGHPLSESLLCHELTRLAETSHAASDLARTHTPPIAIWE